MNINIDIRQLFETLQSIQNIDLRQVFKKTTLLVNIVIIIITLIIIVVVYQKQTMQIKSLEEKIREAEGSTDIINRIENGNKEIESYLKKLPAAKDFPDIINIITDIANSNNIEITNISLDKKKYGEQYYTLPLNISLRGLYYDIWNFLRGIDNSKEFFTLESVNILGPAPSSRFKKEKEGNYSMAEIRLFATSIKKE